MNKYKKLRKRTGLSAVRLAEFIGTNYMSIWNWEQGRTKPRSEIMTKRIKRLAKLADELKKDHDYLAILDD